MTLNTEVGGWHHSCEKCSAVRSTEGNNSRIGVELGCLLLRRAAPPALLPNKGQPSFQFGTEVGAFSCDLHGLSGRFPTEPLIQFLPRRVDVSTAFFDWYTRICPALCDRHWLSKEGGDLLPAFQQVGRWFRLFARRHGASTMRALTAGLQPERL